MLSVIAVLMPSVQRLMGKLPLDWPPYMYLPMKPITSNRIEFEGESIADRGCSMYTPVSTFKSIDFAEIISLQCVDKYVYTY